MPANLTEAEIDVLSLKEVLRWDALRSQIGLLRGMAAQRLGLTVDACPYSVEDAARTGWLIAFQPAAARED
jgi:hypothetical protein